MSKKFKKKINKLIYTAIVAAVGFILVELGIVDPAVAGLNGGYPVPIEKHGDTVSFLSTGQSDCALISSGGEYCLIDVGQTESGHIGVVEYLNNAGVEEIELMIVTHFHSDHTSELLDVMDNFRINNIIIPDLNKENVPTAEYFKKFLSKVEEDNIKLIAAQKGVQHTVGNGVVTILADTYNDLEINSTSVASLFTQGEFTFLSTGDGEKEYEERLLKDFSEKVTLFVAGHHGSGDANTKNFITAIKPDFVAISAGKDNDYGHPHREVVQLFKDMGIPYKVTAEDGTIVYSITDNKVL